MVLQNSLAFRLNFNGTPLIAAPSENESLHEAMTRTIAQHAGSEVSDCGRCKKTGEHYSYPITLANGIKGRAIVEGNA